MPQDTVLTKLRARLKELSDERESWVPGWKEVQEYICPRQGRHLSGDEKPNEGKRKDQSIIDGTATDALDIMASGMQSGLTSKARPWFRLVHRDPKMNENVKIQKWYSVVMDVMYYIFQRSNVYEALYQVYYELGAFGVGSMAILESAEDVIRCRPFTVGEYYLDNNASLKVDTFYRKEFMTARQMVNSFGKDRVSETVLSAYNDNNLNKRFEVINIIEPNDDRIDLKDAGGMPIRSIYFEAKGDDGGKNGNRGLLRVKGYHEMPIMAPRWSVVSNDVYGWGPCGKIIGDTKMLQRVTKDLLKGVAKSVNPPMAAPPDMKHEGLITSPGAINYTNGLGERSGLTPLYLVNVDYSGLKEVQADTRYRIKNGLYNQLFLMLTQRVNDRQMTATEVAERHEEKLLMLGPVLERIHNELLDPLIGRTFSLAWRAGMIPEPPPELQSDDIRVEYISILSQAQKSVATKAIEQVTGFVGSVAAIFPEATHKYDPLQAIDIYANAVGVTPGVIRSDEEAQKRIDAQNQMARQQQQIEMLKNAASGAKVMSETDADNLNDVQQAILGSGGGIQ